jgi:hypothetical protein
MSFGHFLSAKLFHRVLFRGLVGKLRLIAVVTPLTTLSAVALGDPALLQQALYCNMALVAGLVCAMVWYTDRHPIEAVLEGPDLVRYHRQGQRDQNPGRG